MDYESDCWMQRAQAAARASVEGLNRLGAALDRAAALLKKHTIYPLAARHGKSSRQEKYSKLGTKP